MPTSPDPRPWRPVRRAATVVVAVAALAVALGVGGAPAAASAPPADEAAAQRVLLISVPGLTWAEVRDHDL
ncbi:MAG: hypothetical protein ACRD0R_11280, partial [Acidimicrobiales bacterium]